MAIAGDQCEIVLQDQGGNPEIVIGNRRTGSLELDEQAGLPFRSFAAGEQNGNRGFG